jgi:hypothetical protein
MAVKPASIRRGAGRRGAQQANDGTSRLFIVNSG